MNYEDLSHRRKTFRRHAQIAVFLLLCAAIELSIVKPASANIIGCTESEIVRILNQAEERGINGNVFISSEGNLVVDQGLGWTSRERTQKVKSDTLFNIASVSKAITATAIFALRDENRLKLDWPLARFFSNVPADKAEITIAELLDHTSCIPQKYAADGKRSQNDAVSAVFATPLKCRPGRSFVYSDDNYALLAAIIERAGGQSYEEYVRSHVFNRAAMSQTMFWSEIDDRDTPNVARILNPPSVGVFRGTNWGYIGSGGIWSTAHDLARFALALGRGDIISKASVEEMLRPREKVSIGWATYGWFVVTRPAGSRLIVSRGNEDWGHSAVIYWRPGTKTVVSVTSNSGFDQGVPFARVLAGQIEPFVLQDQAPCPHVSPIPPDTFRSSTPSARLLAGR